MKLESRKLAQLGSIAALAVGGAVSPALAVSSTGADLSAAIKTTTAKPRPGKHVYFRVTVTNQGPDATSGFQVALLTHQGLVDPRVVVAPPDSVRTVCPVTTAPGGSAGCRTTWIPPRCTASKHALTCRYRTLELTPPSGPSSSITLVLKATTGARRHELAVASVTGKDDPNRTNNTASAKLIVSRHRASPHRPPGHHRPSRRR